MTNETSNASRTEEKRKIQSFSIMRADELYNLPEVKEQFLVDRLLPLGGLSILAGKPKDGKSCLARQLAIDVAQGRDFLGRETMRSGVLYLGLEESASQFQRAAKAAGMKPNDSIYAMFERVKVTPACAVQMINANLEEHRDIGLVVVDTLFKLARAKDTNSYTDSSDSLEPWHNLAMKHNIAILGLHHNRKAVSADAASSTNMSGSTAIAANATNIIEIYRQRANDASSQRIIRMNEYRFGDELQPLLLSFDKETQRYTAAGALSDFDAQEAKQRMQEIEGRVVDFVTNNPGREQKDIVQAVQGRTTDVKAVLYRLFKGDNPILKRTGDGVKFGPYLYFPVDLIEEAAA